MFSIFLYGLIGYNDTLFLCCFARAMYEDGIIVDTRLYEVQMDVALANENGTGGLARAAFVERCVCPQGYVGSSCEVRFFMNENMKNCNFTTCLLFF